MTPTERAEYLANLHHLPEGQYYDDRVKIVAAQISEAEREAYLAGITVGQACCVSCKETYHIIDCPCHAKRDGMKELDEFRKEK